VHVAFKSPYVNWFVTELCRECAVVTVYVVAPGTELSATVHRAQPNKHRCIASLKLAAVTQTTKRSSYKKGKGEVVPVHTVKVYGGLQV